MVATPCINLVDPPAIISNLSSGSSEGPDISHLDHASNKIWSEGVFIGAIGTDYWISGSSIEQLLIRMEQAPLVNQVLVIIVLKTCRSLQIKWCQVVVPRARSTWAVWPSCLSQGTVYGGLIIYACPKVCASCLSNCVGTLHV